MSGVYKGWQESYITLMKKPEEIALAVVNGGQGRNRTTDTRIFRRYLTKEIPAQSIALAQGAAWCRKTRLTT